LKYNDEKRSGKFPDLSFFKVPSPGRGAAECVVAGRGFCAMKANYTNPYLLLPRGRNRARLWLLTAKQKRSGKIPGPFSIKD